MDAAAIARGADRHPRTGRGRSCTLKAPADVDLECDEGGLEWSGYDALEHPGPRSLVVEAMVISKRSRNDVFLLYEKDLVNDELLKKVKDRVRFKQYGFDPKYSDIRAIHRRTTKISFSNYSLYRSPDRASSFIEAGHVVLLMENSPSCLVFLLPFGHLSIRQKINTCGHRMEISFDF